MACDQFRLPSSKATIIGIESNDLWSIQWIIGLLWVRFARGETSC